MTATAWRFTRSAHLVELIAEVERLAERVRDREHSPDDVSVIAALQEEAALASLRLDGSRLDAPPTGPHPSRRTAPTTKVPERRQGTWLDAMAHELASASDHEIAALEYHGVRDALDADELAESLLATPLDALAELHRRLTVGLLDAEHAGRPRRSEQAVHDASVGRIIYFPADPAAIPTRLNLLSGWLQTHGAREHALVSSGVLQFELLHIHPYEAANGRLARAAARLVLRARGLDPEAAAIPEVALARDPIGYYEEVARTVRRRDLTIWLERWGEAAAAGLREASARLGLRPAELSQRPASFLDRWDEPRFTIADYRATAPAGPEESRSDLRELLDAGRVRRVPGTRGLRYELV